MTELRTHGFKNMDILRVKSPDAGALKGIAESTAILKKFSSNPHACLYTARIDNKIAGFAFLIFLEWDSNIFGFKIGRIENLVMKMDESLKRDFLVNMIDDCKKEGYHHINCRIGVEDLGDIRLLERLGFNIADVQITLSTSGRLDPEPVNFNGFTIRQATPEDLEGLERVVSGAFSTTRFASDPRYARDKVDRLYFEWLKGSIADNSQTVFVIQESGSGIPVGFGICSVDPYSSEALGVRIGSIDLIAVIERCRGKGIGRMFIRFILNWFSARVERVEIRTQVSNHRAINAFMNSGLNKVCAGTALPAGIAMHLWFQEG